MKNNRKLTAIVSIFLIGFLVAIALFLDIDIKEFVVYSILAVASVFVPIAFWHGVIKNEKR